MEKLGCRQEADAKDCWNMQDLYESDELWEQDAARLETEMEDFGKYRGALGGSASHLFLTLQAKDELEKRMERIYVYAGQKNHEDMGNPKYQGYNQKAQSLMARLGDALSFLEPEILAVPQETLERFQGEMPQLALYERYLREQLRKKEHILSQDMEAVLAKASEMGQGPQNIFMMFNNADLDFGTTLGEDGKQTPLTHGRYQIFLESRNPQVRREAFQKLYACYGKFRNTLAATFTANVQQELFFSQMRKYSSSREAALDQGNIPVAVYDQLIEAVHKNLPAMYDYVALRKKALGVDELHMYDLYVPLVQKVDKRYSFEEAKELVKLGLAPLGTEYGKILEEGFCGGWIDIYENQGKRSGAYSWGAYGTHPYVLLNYNGSLNHVFTLAHEMGHAIHSYYSDKSQPYLYAGYKIFVAEVASTCNEALLIHYLLGQAADRQERAYLVSYFLDQFKGTVYRQTMFAEFEKIVHEKVQAGESLTADSLNELYYGLNQTYYGEDMAVDREIAMEWSRIPHFYTPFYVYQYATGFSAAIAISNKILDGEPGIVEKYKQFLSGGSSKDPIELLKICGVDMTSPRPVEQALYTFREYVSELLHLI